MSFIKCMYSKNFLLWVVFLAHLKIVKEINNIITFF